RPDALTAVYIPALAFSKQETKNGVLSGSYAASDPTVRIRSTVDQKPLQRTEQRHRAARDPWQLLQAMRSRISAPATLELLGGDRAPQLIHDARGLTGHIVERALQVLGPQAQANIAGKALVAAHEVHLGVVEQRVLVEVGRADREPGIVD